MIGLVALVLAVLVLGVALLRALGVPRTLGWATWAGWAYVLGAAGAALVALGWSALGWTGRAPGAQLAVLLLLAGALWLAGARRPRLAVPPPRPAGRAERSLLVLALAVVVAVLAVRAFDASARPVLDGDEAHFYALKARVLYGAGDLGEAYHHLAARRSHHANFDYPPLNPLLQLLVFEQAGHVTWAANRLLVQGFVPALVLALAGAAARHARPAVAALLVLAIGGSRCLSTYGTAALSDFLVAAALVAAADAALLAAHDPRFVRLLAAFATAAVLAKHDARLALVAGLLAAGLEVLLTRPGRRALAALGWLALPGAALALVALLNARADAVNLFDGSADGSSLVGRVLAQAPERLPGVLHAFGANVLLDPGTAGLVPLALLALVVLAPRTAFAPPVRAPLVGLGLAVGGLLLVFAGLPHDEGWHWATAGERVFFQLVPAAGVLAAALLGRSAGPTAHAEGGRAPVVGHPAPGAPNAYGTIRPLHARAAPAPPVMQQPLDRSIARPSLRATALALVVLGGLLTGGCSSGPSDDGGAAATARDGATGTTTEAGAAATETTHHAPTTADPAAPSTTMAATPSSDTPAGAAPLEIATFGAGCFWCVEAVLEQVEGVQDVTSGYMGGSKPNPTYKEVCTGTTGHAEVVQVHFDPRVLPYEHLLAWFWKLHDPTTLNRQGADVGTQYRSAIFTHSEDQAEIARRSLEAAQADFADPIVTEITPASTYYVAEDYHQDYYRANKSQGYCRMVIAPKLEKLDLEK